MISAVEANDFPVLARLWERSVRATHHFLSESELQFYRSRITDEYFPQVRLWKYSVDGTVAGFIGLSDMIEMLFVSPDCFRKGVGTALLDFAVKEMKMTRVDVNEQNAGALAFYLSKGFKRIGRSETDAEGKPYPIIHLSL